MRWELSEEQTDFRSTLRDWLRDRCPSPVLREWLDSGEYGAFERQFAAAGWFSVGSSEEIGGEGGGLVELALTAEEVGRRVAPASAWFGSMLAVPALSTTPDAAKELLADGVTTVLAVPAQSVPGGRPTVSDDGDGLVGSVAGVLGADRARRMVVPVRHRHGLALVLVDADSPGVQVRGRVLTDRTRTVADVVFTGATGVSLATDPEAVLRDTALRAAVLTAADSLGLAAQMLDMTVEYSGQRKQFGVPIGSFQAVKHAAAEMLVQVESARSIVYLAAASVEVGHPDAPLHAAAAKAQVTADVAAAADTSLTLHGAIGYTWEHDLQLYYKRAKLNQQLFGTPTVWNERIAEALGLCAGEEPHSSFGQSFDKVSP
ncbi:acyl-CoA dehydrogenase family protein [Actinokineospora sp.]|uniref:acyl-CoA dehydrogenase family protein n=1 Tax=Actinokineospora sp. TaxID=1872133 RepID=UPI00403787C7